MIWQILPIVEFVLVLKKPYAESYLTHIKYVLLMFLTLGLGIPAAQKIRLRFLTNQMRYGTSAFQLDSNEMSLYRGFFATAAATFGTWVLFMVGIFTFVFAVKYLGFDSSKLNPKVQQSLLVSAIFPFYFFMTLLAFSYKGYVFKARINYTHLGELHFKSQLSVIKYGVIWVTNLLVSILSLGLGLLWPWASLRMTRYIVRNVSFSGPADALNKFSSAPSSRILGAAEGALDLVS